MCFIPDITLRQILTLKHGPIQRIIDRVGHWRQKRMMRNDASHSAPRTLTHISAARYSGLPYWNGFKILTDWPNFKLMNQDYWTLQHVSWTRSSSQPGTHNIIVIQEPWENTIKHWKCIILHNENPFYESFSIGMNWCLPFIQLHPKSQIILAVLIWTYIILLAEWDKNSIDRYNEAKICRCSGVIVQSLIIRQS
jgi:hypothetical protein